MDRRHIAFLAILILIAWNSAVHSADWPQWAGGPTRNPVSLEKGLSLDFKFEVVNDDGKVTKEATGMTWKARLGDRTVIPPVIADGLIWVCTSARNPNDEKIPSKDWDGGVLMCLRDSDGKLLWEQRSPRLGNHIADCPHSALGSAPLVEGDRLWHTNNRHEIVCFDIAPLKKGTGKPKEVWKLDMPAKLGVFPYIPIMVSGFAASVAGYKDKLYVVTHNGVDETHANIPSPDAPSLVCVEKATGKVLWKDNTPGKNILHCQISSPLVVEIEGKPQVIVGQGDGWLRAFDATTGKVLWKCDLNSKDAVYDLGGTGNRNYVVATPTYYDGRVYAVTGRDIEHWSGPAALYCIDPTKQGDVSVELDAGPKKGKPNPNSAVVWYTPKEVPKDAPVIEVGKKKLDLLRSRDFYFGRSISGCVVHDGLLYSVDVSGLLFCFDAKTGKLYWAEDLKNGVRGQLLWVDGKILVATDGGELFAFAHGKEKKQLVKIESPSSFYAGPIYANGTLYLPTDNTLYAIRKPK